MSENFAYISLASFLCYILLFFTFIAAKKNRIINSFIGLLICTSLWTGGSFLMRINLFGATKLWYDVSIFGMTWALYAVLLFTLNYIGIKKSHKKPFWFFVILITNIVNISTGFLLAAPDLVVTPSGHTTFVYTYGAGVVLFSLISLAIIVDSFIIAARKSKHNDVSSTQLLPIMIGLFVVFIGNIAIMLPVFTGFPIDILAGLVNALILFYALFLRRLFKLTLLVSKTNCYFVSAIFSVLIFGNLINTIESFISTYFHVLEEYKTLVIALIFTTSISAIYFLLKKFFDTVFLGAENIRNENLRQFSFAASKSLELNDILELLVCVIKKTIGVRKVYVCILDQKTNGYKMIHTTSPLDKPNYYIQKDNPLVLLLKKQNQCLLLSNFNRTIEYKSMWENEKKQISDLDIECFMPLKDNDTLVGFIMLTSKDKKVPFSYEDISFLDSVSSISSIAVKNSRMYQKMYYEAHTDELTDVLNRKYFFEVLQDEWTNNITSCLSLIMLSVDDFKLYNQLYGNNEGDIALKKIASILKSTVSENGYVARYSGKEFAIILPSRDVLFTKNLAQNLCTQISAINKSTSNYALKMLTASC
ncbi:MAG: diguanylate cyclase, partial [Oscillospiraceae bacterium]